MRECTPCRYICLETTACRSSLTYKSLNNKLYKTGRKFYICFKSVIQTNVKCLSVFVLQTGRKFYICLKTVLNSNNRYLSVFVCLRGNWLVTPGKVETDRLGSGVNVTVSNVTLTIRPDSSLSLSWRQGSYENIIVAANFLQHTHSVQLMCLIKGGKYRCIFFKMLLLVLNVSIVT